MEIIIIIYGLIIGSFLNVLIYRLPLEQSFFKPIRSNCTSCGYTIKWYENIPVLSYLYLKGRCSSCKDKISIVYPIVEVISALITYMILDKFGITINGFIVLFLFYILIVLSFIDFKYKAVPDYLLLLSLVVALFISDFNYKSMLIFTGGFVLLNFIITYYIQNIKSKIVKDEQLKEQTALGEGDIPIIAIIGGLLGLKLSIVAFFIAALSAIIPSLYNILFKKDIETPFIPFLVFGLFISLFFGKYLESLVNIS